MIDLKPGLLVSAALITSSCGPELVREVPLEITNLTGNGENSPDAELRPVDSASAITWPADMDIDFDSCNWCQRKAMSDNPSGVVGIMLWPKYGTENILIDSLNVNFGFSRAYLDAHEISAAIKYYDDGSAEVALDLTEHK